MEVLIYNEILTPPHMFDLPLTLINDTDPPIFFSESEAKLNINQLPPIDKPTDIHT